MENCTYIDGIGSSQVIDSSGEIVDLEGLDISSMEKSGVLNWEHKNDSPDQIIGKILKAKKIFSQKDCENDREFYYWNKVKAPFLYIIGELMDGYKDSAKEVAGMFKYSSDRKDKDNSTVLGFSVEGSKLLSEGNIVKKSIARRVTITGAPCNKTCVAELIPPPSQAKPKSDPSDIFKSELYTEISLIKKEKEDSLTKALPGSAPMAPSTPKPAWSAGQQKGNAVHFDHPEHGTVTISKQPSSGMFHVKHNGALAGVGGTKGEFHTPEQAKLHAVKYMTAVHNKTVAPKQMANMPSTPGVKKSEDHEKIVNDNNPYTRITIASNPNLDPKHHEKLVNDDYTSVRQAIASNPSLDPKHHEKLVNDKSASVRMTIARNPNLDPKHHEKLLNDSDPHVRHNMANIIDHRNSVKKSEGTEKKKSKKKNKPYFIPPGMQATPVTVDPETQTIIPDSEGLEKTLTAGSSNVAPSALSGGAALSKEALKSKKKNKERSNEEYSKWAKREEFEKFMKARMPFLAKGEVVAIGKTLVLKKSLEAEAALCKLISMTKSLKFGSDEDQKNIAIQNEERKKNPPKKTEPKAKVPKLTHPIESEVVKVRTSGGYTPVGYSESDEITLKSGHELHGHPKGKFKVGDKVVATPHIMGTHLLEHKK